MCGQIAGNAHFRTLRRVSKIVDFGSFWLILAHFGSFWSPQDFDRPKNDRRGKNKVGEVICGKIAQNEHFRTLRRLCKRRNILISAHFGTPLESLRPRSAQKW